jgi:general secretion pathway protein M
MDKLLHSFSQFNRREQMTILLGGLALGFYLLWILLLAPLQHKRDSLLSVNTNTEQSLGRVQLLVRQIEGLQQQSTQSNAGSGDISALIDTSLRDNSLTMSGFQPAAAGEVRVRIDKANSEHLMQWLYELESKYHVSIRELSITSSNDPGQVAVNVRLLKP